jgi:hypothetical protein
MSEEQMIQLLQEIRDLQRQQVENSTVALRNQQDSIEKQRRAIEYYRTVTRRLTIVSAPLLLVVLALLWWLMRSPFFP